MNQSVTMKHLAILALVLVAFILVAANWDKLPGRGGARDDGRNVVPDPGKIPFDLAYLRAIGGWEKLSVAQQSWARQRYLSDLRGLYRILQRLRATAVSFG